MNPAYLTYKGRDIYLSFQKAKDKWRCSHTLGCWPKFPVRQQLAGQGKGFCRLPNVTSTNPSPVWFMPPPMLKIEHRNYLVRACVLRGCTSKDIHDEKVGR